MNKKDFYLKKIGRRGKIDIWLVDGAKIRRDLEKDFTNFAEYYYFPIIPKYEFWIDRESVPNERRFFIDHLLAEWRLMDGGMSYQRAKEIANQKELSERKKAGDLEKVINQKSEFSPEKVHRRLLDKTKDEIDIWLVDGRLVRSAFDIGFTEGGHDLVYQYVPKNEVWIDDDVFAKERPYVLLHELYERSLMKSGLTYLRAHRKASRLEWRARHSEQILDEFFLKFLIKKGKI
ncbi:MAG: hypothetical protein CO160_02335 [Candidatus Portnoybacteria bacterium CG_4_9_14_3_um_filter_43_11]|uniref:Uncharacterized protein n=3 Tax=Candidatus Portnoyibacteriota TaxID=1817913 RepID=A0A2M7YL24_9BACT|nr:MAG: hypothetical protein CO160_02335 [Candidatus Portnoybacteria bacterium CG_4_9_14_3_um_filter_43_11]